MGSMGVDASEVAIGQLADVVAALLEVPLGDLSNDGVVEAMQRVESCARQLVCVSRRLTVEAVERKLPEALGLGTIKKFLSDTLRLSGPDAGARARATMMLGTWHDLLGNPVRIPLGMVAEAQVAGDISPDHVRAIEAVMKRIPDSCTPADREAAQDQLVTYARTGWPEDIPAVGDRILGYLDPDGTLSGDKDRARMRGIVLGRQRADGMRTIKGEITPELSALLDPVLAKLARPGMCNPDDAESPTAATYVDTEVLRAAAGRDSRTSAQRNHDAFLALLQPGVTPDGLGSHRGLPVTTILTMTIDQVEAAAGVVTTATGGTVPISTALKLAERSKPYLAVFDHAGLPLHLGREKRLATPAQRMALIASIRGCSRPGCDAPASISAVHHVSEWVKGGPTDLANETLACDRCHALVHDGPGGWQTRVLGKESPYAGRTAWIAPRHLDHTGTPKVNHRHHAGELLAQTVARITVRNEREAEERRKRWQRMHSHAPAPTGLPAAAE
ncbi:DUF222 domain-containing protein [Nocardia sp. NPDC056000]|uniref:HNH endonuclease signature motif containing protein n=1 Tax=Nocardia sp. NPDC056000 TaxID=3345674 RepID=UPI0035DE8764